MIQAICGQGRNHLRQPLRSVSVAIKMMSTMSETSQSGFKPPISTAESGLNPAERELLRALTPGDKSRNRARQLLNLGMPIPRLQTSSSFYEPWLLDWQHAERALGNERLKQLATHLQSYEVELTNLPLKTLPLSMGLPASMKRLVIKDCEELKALPFNLGDNERLEEVHLIGCTSLTDLPNSIWKLPYLSLRRCNNLARLPESNDETKTQHLNIVDCPQIIELPHKVQLRELAVFILEGSPALQRLPNIFGNCPSLKIVKIRNCPQLTELPENMFQQQTESCSLTISGCPRITRLPASLWQVPKLLINMPIPL